MLTTLRQLWDLVGRERPWPWVLLVVLAVAVSLMEMVGAVLVYAMLVTIVEPGESVVVPVLGNLHDGISTSDGEQFVLVVVAIVGAFFVVRGVVRVGAAYAEGRVTHNAGARLSRALASTYMAWPYARHLHRGSSELIRNGHQMVIELVIDVLLPTVKVFAESVLIVGMLVALFILSPQATLLAVAVVGSAAALLLLVVQPHLKRLGRVYLEESGSTLESLQQMLHGIRDVRLLGREGQFVDRYAVGRARMARQMYLRHTIAQVPLIVIETALVASMLLYLGLAIRLGTSGPQTLATLGMFAYAGLRMVNPLRYLIVGLNGLRFGAPAVHAVHADLREGAAHPGSLADDVGPLSFTGPLELCGVSFRYEGASVDTLSHVDLRIERGEHVGVCGPTGGGKSTLIDLMVGLLEPTHGEVRVNGEALAGRVRRWQRSVGFVPQMVFLVDDTIRANVALGVPDDEVDADAVARAIALAELSNFVDSLPDGDQTVVGERGVRLSGGQRQRIAIARALYRDPDIIVLDEATSSLDEETQAALSRSIGRLAGDRTVIAVAHRLSTLKMCDRVISVRGGRVGTVSPLQVRV